MIRVVPAAQKHHNTPAIVGDRYLLVEEIGRGRTASVHRAWDREKAEEVAVKVPLVPGCLLARDIFENEANALRRVKHPNIVEMIDEGESGPGRFIVMELIRGTCLRDLLMQKKLGLEQRLRIVSEICGALAAAHDAGIVHRDVKPRNIMVADAGAKLLDFGYANIESKFCCRYLTKERFGSPLYSAPELTKDSADPRLDIYSLGVMMYEMFLKGAPLRIISAIRLLEIQHSLKHLKRQVSRGKIPRIAADIIEAAVHRDPKERICSVRAFGEMLEQLIVDI